MIFTTESGSTYQVDRSNNTCRVRKLSGRYPNKAPMPPNGEWKDCLAVNVVVGHPGIITWALIGAQYKITTTSRVVSITRNCGAVESSYGVVGVS